MLDLYHASRDDLLRLVGAQRDRIADLERQVAAQAAELATQRAAIAGLTARLGAALGAEAPAGEEPGGDAGGPVARGRPGLNPPRPPTRAPCPRKRRPHSCARRRMAPTARRAHALAACPACGARLAGGTVKRTREVIELSLAPAVVTEHVYLERRCPRCGRRGVPPPQLDGVVAGQSRLGIGLVSLIAVLREEARLPFATIQTLLRAVHGVDLSAGALVGAVARVAKRAKPAVAGIRAAVRASPVVHADETGWREGGQNGYVWTFSTPTERYYVRGTREKTVLDEALGGAFAGVLVSDFYAAYTNYEGLHQYCWAHLLRDVRELAQQHRRDAAVVGWADAVHDVFARARAFSGPDPAARRDAARAFQAELAALGAPFLPPPAPPPAPDAADPPAAEPPADALAAPVPPQRTLCQRIDKHLEALFVFVADPAVPATNNAAERSLRPLVVARKVSGGTRSAAGSTTRLTIASLFGTWRARGLNPFQECQRLLAAPQG